MSATVTRIAELLKDARLRGSEDDPAYFDRKADIFDAIAKESPHLGPESRLFAARARARAQELRFKAQRAARRM